MSDQVVSLKGAAGGKTDPQPAISIHELDKADKRESSSVTESSSLVELEESIDSHSLWPWGSSSKKPDPDSIATVRSVFDDPVLAPYYTPKPEYENAHRFDVKERWTVREENTLRRAIDWKIFLWILVMFFGLNIDRGNLGNATADNLLDDLGITTNDYNNAQNMYRVGFLIAEIPSQVRFCQDFLLSVSGH